MKNLILLFCLFFTTNLAMAQGHSDNLIILNQDEYKGNPILGKDPSYLRVSAVKTIIGPRAQLESFGIAFKFNFKVTDTGTDVTKFIDTKDTTGQVKYDFNKAHVYSSRYFSMISAETSVFDSSSAIPANAMVSLNAYLGVGKKNHQKDSLKRKGRKPSLPRIEGVLERLMFCGGGTKVFAGKFYTGLHLGSVEVSGLYKNSYWLGGIYAPISKGENLDFSWVNDGDDSNDGFKPYFYMEGNVGLSKDARLKIINEDDKSIDKTLTYISNVLQSVRFKFEVLQPIITDLDLNDTKVRFSLSIPILAILQ